MKRRIFLGLLASVWTVPVVGKAYGKTEAAAEKDWEWDSWQTSPAEIRALADCYVSDFGSVIIKRR